MKTRVKERYNVTLNQRNMEIIQRIADKQGVSRSSYIDDLIAADIKEKNFLFARSYEQEQIVGQVRL